MMLLKANAEYIGLDRSKLDELSNTLIEKHWSLIRREEEVLK